MNTPKDKNDLKPVGFAIYKHLTGSYSTGGVKVTAMKPVPVNETQKKLLEASEDIPVKVFKTEKEAEKFWKAAYKKVTGVDLDEAKK